MTNNELIAEWAGWKRPETKNGSFGAGLMFHIGCGDGEWYDTGLDRKLENGRRIPVDVVHRHLFWTSPDGRALSGLPSFDTDIALWHGNDGLLAEIKKVGWKTPFLDRLFSQNRDGDDMWFLLSATPGLLTTALVKTIAWHKRR